MRQAATVILILATLLLDSSSVWAGAPLVDGEVLVKFKRATSASEMAAVHRNNGSAVRGVISGIEVQRVTAPKGREIEHAKRYKGFGCVEFAEPNYIASVSDIIPSDPYFQDQWDLVSIHAPAAWDLDCGASGITVAIIDTGVDYTHPDLAPRVVAGYDFRNGDSDPMDDHGHGTAVAGIVGACTNNGIGVAGVTWYTAIMPIKVASASGSASYSAIASGITYAADRGARVANISIAGSMASSTLENAVNYALNRGCLVVAASGNNGVNMVYYPAACANAVAVGASDQYGQPTSYSNYGSALDVIAPGGGYTTTRGGGYGGFGGTSAASPHAAGVAALIVSANPILTADAVASILKDGADDVGPAGWDEKTGWGLVNAYNSLVNVDSPKPDTEPPFVSITSPSNGATVSGTVTVRASATDNVSVSRVDFFVDGAYAGTASGTYTWSWNTTSVANGGHTLVAKATDGSGNVGSSSPVSVNVDNSSSDTQTFKGSVSKKTGPKSHSWKATSTANVEATMTWSGRADLELALYDQQGTLVASSRSQSAPLQLKLSSLPAGSYTLTVTAVSGKAKYTLDVKAKSL